ncbi:MAG TPA: PQQ-dependent sugar dehydrogenase, partial [Steroidobacteraceae bacterium]
MSILIAAMAAAITARAADVAPEPVRGPPPPPQPAKLVKIGYKVTEIAKGLDHPWSMAFLPDGSILVTERVGRLRLIKNGSLQPEPIDGVPAVHTGSQAGLFDIV